MERRLLTFVARQLDEVASLRMEMESSRAERDRLLEQLITSGKVLCDLEQNVSSLYQRIMPVYTPSPACSAIIIIVIIIGCPSCGYKIRFK